MHGLDYDDTHVPGVLHPTVSLLPTVLAQGAALHASGRDMLAAFVLGVETATRLATVAKQATDLRKRLAGMSATYLKSMKEYLAVVAELEKSGEPSESTDYHKLESHLSFVSEEVKTLSVQVVKWAAKYPAN